MHAMREEAAILAAGFQLSEHFRHSGVNGLEAGWAQRKQLGARGATNQIGPQQSPRRKIPGVGGNHNGLDVQLAGHLRGQQGTCAWSVPIMSASASTMCST
jgi:hypothetical protein